MKNQKAAQVLSAQSLFDVLQTSDGQALFFSIGDEKVFYLSAEQDNVKTGWTPVDLSTELAKNFPGKTVIAKTFAASQSITDGTITIAQAVHVVEENADYLYLLTNLSDAPDAAWLHAPVNRAWVARPFHAAQPSPHLDIAYIRISPNQDPAQAPYMIVGVQDASTSFIQNYVVSLNPSAPGALWTIYQTAENYDQLLGMHIGKTSAAMFAGLYELYTLNDAAALTFTPLQSLFAPPAITKLTPPAGASSLATLPAGAVGDTNLYVAGNGGIYFFAPAAQTNFATGTEIIRSSLIAGVESLEVHLSGAQVVLWGRNNQGQLFYSRCPQERQGDPNAWSSPVPIEQNASQMASLLNRKTQASELYVHTQDRNLVKLAEDPVTTQWRTQSILLPSLGVNDVVEFYTFTTHINVVDENNLLQPNAGFPLTATSPCTIYLNDHYVTLSDTVQLQAQSDATGTLTLVQETQSLGAVCYNLVQGDDTVVNVNPMSGSMSLLAAVHNGSDLAEVKVTDEQGNTSALLPSSVTPQQQHATAQSIAQFVQISNNMPQDGSVKSSSPTSAERPSTAFDPQTDKVWGISFADEDVRYFEGLEQLAGVGLSLVNGELAMAAPGTAGDIGHSIEARAGDIFRWIEQAMKDVVHFVVKVADDVAHFFIQIGQQWYHFILRCINDVAHGIQFVLKRIGAFFEKLVQWLGSIFDWKDIRRTHRVIKNIFKRYAQSCIDDLPTYKGELSDLFVGLEDKLDAWAGLPSVSEGTVTGVSSASTPLPGQGSPRAHWGVHHIKSNMTAASTGFLPNVPGGSELEQLLGELWTLIQNEAATFETAIENLRTQVVDQITTLPAGEIVKRVIAIFLDVLLDTIKNIALAVIDILQLFLQGALDMLDKKLDIPVISWMYKLISGDDLSILDLACLIVAIPATVIYKLAKSEVPFPDDAATDALIHAPDFATIRKLLGGQTATGERTPAEAALGASSAAGVVPVVFDIAAYFATLGLIPLTGWKAANPNSKPAYILYAILYLPYIAPGIQLYTPQTWDVKLNERITGLSLLKSLADVGLYRYKKGVPDQSKGLEDWYKVSPYVEAGINALWEIPAIAGIVRSQDTEAVIGFLGNTAFNLSGVLSPKADNDYVFAAILICMGIYGELELVTGLTGSTEQLALT
jgi:hypothetical protein